MPYSEKEYQNSNVNYLNKDFSSLKTTLIEYAKTHFPNSYRDFNETSPGMMLIEMAAYVGDVLSFYIDNQYKEMLLPLAEERRNVINLANMLGYKVKPTSPAYVDLDISQTVGANQVNLDNIIPAYNDAQVIDKGLKVNSTADSSIIFETLDIVDFTVSQSQTVPVVSDTDENGLATQFTLTRKVRAISGETKTKTFSIGSPEKFKRITFPENNIIEILSVKDSNNNRWYEVEYLAQDKIPQEEYYVGNRVLQSDDTLSSAYYSIDGNAVETVPVPYTLEFIKAPKRFIIEINDDNTTSLVFGNGILHQGFSDDLESGFFQTEQVGITIPGETEDISTDISTLISTNLASLGESPSNTTLTVEYRVGGGISSNVPSGDLTSINGSVSRLVDGNEATPSVTNLEPARGGANEQSVEEIKRKTQAHFITQKRCVTKEDYEARVLAMPAKFGNIAKVSVNRAVNDGVSSGDAIVYSTSADQASSIEIHTLSYDNNKNLVNPPTLLMNNLKNHLNQFRIISDEFVIYPGYVINFGVVFEVLAHKNANKQDVKLRCINTIIDYFNIDKMRFRQIIFTNEIIYELMGLEGVRGINNLELTQDKPTFDEAIEFSPPLYRYQINDGELQEPNGNTGYGYQYDFKSFYNGVNSSDGTILPSLEPSVFELKNPNQNIKGVVL